MSSVAVLDEFQQVGPFKAGQAAADAAAVLLKMKGERLAAQKLPVDFISDDFLRCAVDPSRFSGVGSASPLVHFFFQ